MPVRAVSRVGFQPLDYPNATEILRSMPRVSFYRGLSPARSDSSVPFPWIGPDTLHYGPGETGGSPDAASPRSSGDRAPPSGGGSAGSNPAGGAECFAYSAPILYGVSIQSPAPRCTTGAHQQVPTTQPRPLHRPRCRADHRRYGGRFWPVLRSLAWLALPQMFGYERCEALLRRLSPADAEWMSGRIRIHLVTLGGIEIGTLLEQPGP